MNGKLLPPLFYPFLQAVYPILLLSLFSCLICQPIAIYLKAKGQAKTMPKDVELSFDDAGLHVTVGKEKESIGWKKLRVANEPGMMIVFSDARHGYMLTNRILGAQKEPFFAFAKERIAETN